MANTIIKGIPDTLKEKIGEYGMNLLTKIHNALPGPMYLITGPSDVPYIVIEGDNKPTLQNYIDALSVIDKDAANSDDWGFALISGTGENDLDNETLYEWEDCNG